MPLADFARALRDGPIARERLRRTQPGARIDSRVLFSGDVARVRLGLGVSIHGPSVVSVANGGGLADAALEIGDQTYVGEFCNLRAAGAPIVIGARCLIAQQVSIIGSNHDVRGSGPIAERGWVGSGVRIGSDVWIGAGVVVLPGAEIEDGAVVGANSVVRGRVAAGTVVVGSPATVRRLD